MPAPNTDNFPLLLALYILCKWCEYVEKNKKDIEAYGILCLLALFALTLKLSVAMIIFLTLKPAVEMLRNRKWKTIFAFVFMGILIVVPFCARNVIISGYLVYPSTALNIFDVDWKMPTYSVVFDKKQIIARARGFYDGIQQYELANAMSPIEWLPTWWQHQIVAIKILSVINVILFFPFCIVNYIKLKNKAQNYDITINLTVLIQCLYWMISAPRDRYGIVFMFFIPCMMISHWQSTQKNTRQRLMNIFSMICLVSIMVLFGIELYRTVEKLPLKRSSYYVWRDCEEIEWEGISIYLPLEDTRAGYYFIPSVPYATKLKVLELRGDNLEEGFRIKEEYRKSKIVPSGMILE